MKISFIIPAFNEENSLAKLYHEICDQAKSITDKYEIIFIDDGSTDSTFDILKKLSQRDGRVAIIKLRKNFGKSIALNKGFRFAEGDVVFTMDADLQDDPREIKKFISKLDEGFDMVSGWKQNRQDPFLTKKLPSKFFNFIIKVFMGLKLHDHNCGFKAYRKIALKDLSLNGDLHRYIPTLVHAKGLKVTEIPVNHRPRLYGKSKYGFNRFHHGFLDLITVLFITRYMKRPMHFFGLFGILFSLLGFCICAYLSILWFMGESIGDRPLLMLGVMLLLIGCQVFLTGLIAEMLVFKNRKDSDEDIVECILNDLNA